jgi:hypothetical protein
MQLVFRTARAAVRVRWADYVLSRDFIQEHLERGHPSERFAALHTIGRADVGRIEIVDAARLRGEVLRAWSALRRFDFAESVVVPRTGSARDGCVQAMLGRFIGGVMAITEHALDGDTLLVAREEAPQSRSPSERREVEGRVERVDGAEPDPKRVATRR